MMVSGVIPHAQPSVAPSKKYPVAHLLVAAVAAAIVAGIGGYLLGTYSKGAREYEPEVAFPNSAQIPHQDTSTGGTAQRIEPDPMQPTPSTPPSRQPIRTDARGRADTQQAQADSIRNRIETALNDSTTDVLTASPEMIEAFPEDYYGKRVSVHCEVRGDVDRHNSLDNLHSVGIRSDRHKYYSGWVGDLLITIPDSIAIKIIHGLNADQTYFDCILKAIVVKHSDYAGDHALLFAYQIDVFNRAGELAVSLE